MENTQERIAKCRYKPKMDKRSGFWLVDLTAAAQELLAFITPKGRVFKWMHALRHAYSSASPKPKSPGREEQVRRHRKPDAVVA